MIGHAFQNIFRPLWLPRKLLRNTEKSQPELLNPKGPIQAAAGRTIFL